MLCTYFASNHLKLSFFNYTTKTFITKHSFKKNIKYKKNVSRQTSNKNYNTDTVNVYNNELFKNKC